MSRTASLIALALALILPFAAAAQRHGVPGSGPAADAANAFEVFGTVAAFTTDYGSGMPALTVDDPALGTRVIGLGPAWYLQKEGFSAAAGDEVELLAYPCSTCSAPAVAAWVSNLTADAFVELRDGDGYPLWRLRGNGRGGHPRCDLSGFGKLGAKSGNNGGNGNGPGDGDCDGQGDCDGEGPNGPGDGEGPSGPNGPNGPGGQCGWAAPDMSAVATASGTVVSVDAAPAEGTPSMVLATAEGELVLVISPYHPIAAAGFLIEPGMTLDVAYAPWAVGGEAVLAAISIVDPVTGLVIQLRDPETGYPLHGGPGGPPW